MQIYGKVLETNIIQNKILWKSNANLLENIENLVKKKLLKSNANPLENIENRLKNVLKTNQTPVESIANQCHFYEKLSMHLKNSFPFNKCIPSVKYSKLCSQLSTK